MRQAPYFDFYCDRNVAIWDYVVAGATFDEAAQKFGLTKPRIHQIIKRFMETARRERMQDVQHAHATHWMNWPLAGVNRHAMAHCLRIYSEEWTKVVGALILAKRAERVTQ